MDVSIALQRFNISHTSAVTAVQDVRNYIEDGTSLPTRAAKLMFDLFDITVPLSDYDNHPVGTIDTWATVLAQAAVESAIKSDCIVDDKDVLYATAQARAHAFINNPINSWMFVTAEQIVASGDQVAVSDQVDVKVAVNSDGKIKKGGKEIIATALYEKFQADKKSRDEGPLATDNQAFIAILMKELDMTKAGATTYNYNLKKKLGGVITAKTKK